MFLVSQASHHITAFFTAILQIDGGSVEGLSLFYVSFILFCQNRPEGVGFA
jgi:hypothetical protein